MDLDLLKEKIENNDIEEAEKMIEEIGRRKFVQAVPILISYLKSTDNHGLRNKMAVALSDIGSPEAVDPLITVLKEPRIIGNRGTLLYALEQFDCSDQLELLVDFLIEGNFEVSRQALIIIDLITRDIDKNVIQKCITKIEKEIETHEEKIDFLEESLEILEKLKIDN